MTDRPRQLTAEGLPLKLLQSQWAAIEDVASDIADEIEFKSEGLSDNFLKRAQYASDFFRGDCEYERALQQSTILAFVNPLAKIASEVSVLSKKDVASAVNSGLCTIGRHGVAHRGMFQILMYPIFLMYFVVLGAILSSHFIIPHFAEMYKEFGIAIPWMTSFFIGLGRLIRVITMPTLIVLFGLPPLLWVLNLLGVNKRPPGVTYLDQLLTRKRTTIARWLLHVSLLIEAGLEKGESISLASKVAGKRWLRNSAGRYEKGVEPLLKGDVVEPARFFGQQKYRMADTAIELPRSPGQVALLKQVATWYRDRTTSILLWWVQFLVPMIGFFVIVTVVLFVLSVFAPLLAIISGLTGW